MLILAIYYTIADLVLLAQCFYYRGFTWRDDVPEPSPAPPPKIRKPKRSNNNNNTNGSGSSNAQSSSSEASSSGAATATVDETTSLLSADHDPSPYSTTANSNLTPDYQRRRERRGSDWSHLSPAMPLLTPAIEDEEAMISSAPLLPPPTSPAARKAGAKAPNSRTITRTTTALQSLVFNLLAVLMVCAAGVVGWWLSQTYNQRHHHHPPNPPPEEGGGEGGGELQMSLWGQIFGWFCAVLYLGSRLPQLLLNFRRKSTEGVSMLFFLFACLGNLTYVLSILVFDPSSSKECQQLSPLAAVLLGRSDDGGSGDGGGCDLSRIYWRYILVNLSWLAGSAGTLFLDMGIFVQFFMYSKAGEDDEDDDDEWSYYTDEEGEFGEGREERVVEAGASGVSSTTATTAT